MLIDKKSDKKIADAYKYLSGYCMGDIAKRNYLAILHTAIARRLSPESALCKAAIEDGVKRQNHIFIPNGSLCTYERSDFINAVMESMSCWHSTVCYEIIAEVASFDNALIRIRAERFIADYYNTAFSLKFNPDTCSMTWISVLALRCPPSANKVINEIYLYHCYEIAKEYSDKIETDWTAKNYLDFLDRMYYWINPNLCRF